MLAECQGGKVLLDQNLPGVYGRELGACGHRVAPSVIVDYLHLFWAARNPAKADPPLALHADAVASRQISVEPLKMIPRGRPEVVQLPGCVHHQQCVQGGQLPDPVQPVEALPPPDPLRILIDGGSCPAPP